MIKVFNSPFRITQPFGSDHYLTIGGKKVKASEYYGQWGLAGHEGLDLVPTTSDWTTFSLPYKGQVVKDIDMEEKGGNYGLNNTIWYPEIDEAWQYCHLSSNRLYVDQEIPPVYPIGTMGSTGNTTGAHLHINRFQVDARGYRLNKDNGYLGGIDPLPFLTEHTPPDEEPAEDEDKKRAIEFLDNYRTMRVQGPEGNYEAFARAIVQSDKDIIGMTSKVTQLEEKVKKVQVACEEEKKQLEKDLKEAFAKEKEDLVSSWQSKVESAKKASVDDLGGWELISIGIEKLFKRG